MALSLMRQGKLLEYTTLGWNILGVIILSFAVPGTHSIALVAFGFDSLLEIGASVIVIWELNGTGGSREQKGLRLLSIAFFLLAVYILVQTLINLKDHTKSVESLLGTIWLILTVVAMVILAFKKNRVGRLLNNPVLLTEGRVTLVDAALAALVLTSMLLNDWLGLWWADIAGSYVLMGYCLWEAIHTWKAFRPSKGKRCSTISVVEK